MTGLLSALALLATGALASLLAPRRTGAGLAIGLVAAGSAGILCILVGGSVLLGAAAGPVAIEWPLPLGAVRLALDGLSAWFLIVIGVVTVPVSIYSWGYFTGEHDRGPVRAFGPLMCSMIAALILVVAADDAVLFLAAWELMSLSAFFLIGLHDDDAEVRHGAWTYLIATHLGTAAGVLPHFAAFVARSGSTTFAGFGHALPAGDAAWCVAVFVLGAIGFGTKAGLMPFHVWLPAAHPVAPSPVSALMSGVVIKTGIYGMLRSLSWLPALPVGCSIGLLALAIITGVMGILHALGQRPIKRMLAYSSVENIGIIGIAIALGMLGRSLGQPALEALGLGGALLHVLNHSLFKGLLFLSAGAVVQDAGTGQMERLGGLARKSPLNGLAFLVGAAAICALPPLNGFLSELLIYTGLLNALTTLPNAHAALAVVALAALALIGGLALAGFSKAFAVVFLGEPRDPTVSVRATPRCMKAGMLLLVGACVLVSAGAIGLAPLLAAAVHPLVPDGADIGALRGSLTSLARVAPPLGVFVAIALVLVVARRRMPSGRPAGGAARTWGCGFAAPAARMQYTASSYAWTLIQCFRYLVWPKLCGGAPAGCFPESAQRSTRPTDILVERIYGPLFIGLSRACERLSRLQYGRIQLYLGYIVTTVVLVFLVEAVLRPLPQPPGGRAAKQRTSSAAVPVTMTIRSTAQP